jgi:hypothetical protein
VIPFRIVLIAAALVLAAAPAHAGPLAGIVSGLVAAIKGSALLSAVFRIAGSVVLSKLSQALAPKPRQPGIKTDVTGTGALNPCSFILGRYATDGVHVCPPMSQGQVGNYPNAYLTYVIELGAGVGQEIDTLLIDGEAVAYGPAVDPDYGFTVTTGRFAGRLWVKYYDGSQTVADPMLLAKFGTYPERPWTADMVGHGLCYAILTFRFDRTVYSGFPVPRFVMQGRRLYDPRKDSTAGGSGAHRWANPATWEFSEDPVVMLYNIHRGIEVEGQTWGAGDPASALPNDWWFSRANACDLAVDDGDGGTEPQFRAGYEVFVSEEPAAVAEELLKACLSEVADMGGRWLIAGGDAALPVWFVDDDSLIASQSGESSEFPPPQDTVNAIAANYPEPAMQWQPNPAPLLTNATWEAEDGRRYLATVDYPAAPFAAQVQRIMAATVAAERRFKTHSEPLPPEAMTLDLLDTISWTSAKYGYDGKLFQIGRMVEDLQSGIVQVFLRERDPDDVAIPPGYFTPPGVVSSVPAYVLPGALGTVILGPANPLTLPVPLVITSADTGWISVLSSTLFDGTFPVENQTFTAMVEATLTAGAAIAPLVWRLRISWLGGNLDAFLRSDMLLLGEFQRLTAAGSFVTPDPITNLSLFVSGRGLAAGDSVTITAAHHRALLANH